MNDKFRAQLLLKHMINLFGIKFETRRQQKALSLSRFIACTSKILLLSCIYHALSGCSNLLFYPSKQHIYNPIDLDLEYEDLFINTSDGEALHAWWLPAKQSAKGSILFLHGNAENISTHFSSIAWLPEQGYNVLALDYRGYGLSTGVPDLDGVLKDIDAAFATLTQRSEPPIFILGQSIGASLSLTYLGSSEFAQANTQGLIVDSGFASFRGIAREKLGQAWLTWPFQIPLSWLIPSDYDPKNYIANIAPIPILFFHSNQDQIIPIHHNRELMTYGVGPQYVSINSMPHIATFVDRQQQAVALSFLRGELDIEESAAPENE